MKTESMLLTRREALQGIAGAAVVAMSPVNAFSAGVIAQPVGAGPNGLQPFNDGWRFHHGDVAGAEAAAFSDAAWRVLDVPHDWSIEDLPQERDASRGAIWTEGTTPVRMGPFDMYLSEGGNATGWAVGGLGWYRKTFVKPQSLAAGGKAELHFEGVYMNSEVWINGERLGNHPYGYTEFSFDLTTHLKDGSNMIAVRVDNTGRNSRWYSGSGIFRKVWLEVAGELRIPMHGVYVTTPEVSTDAALVNFAVTVESGAAVERRITVRARMMDAAGSVVGEARQEVAATAGTTSSVECAVRLRSPHLWSPANPYLYRGEVVLEADGKVLDSAKVSVGVRSVEMDAAQGLRINGESVKLRGGCVHHDNGPLGSACIPRAEERRVELLKACGYNAIRTSHNPPSRDFLDACDRLGMLVIDEAFDGWVVAKNPQDYNLYFKQWWQRDVESLVRRDRNHPCVILWSIGNEMNERATPEGVEIGKALAAKVHELDPTRKVTAAICEPYDHPNQKWQDMQPAFTYLDVAGYNYRRDQYENDHAKYPERVMVGTESFPREVYQYWSAVEKSSWVIGDFVWTAMDYIGESGLGAVTLARGPARGGGGLSGYPWFNSYCGDIDLIGNKKPQSFFRDVVWRRSKVEMAVQRPVPKGWTERGGDWSWSDELRSWTWPGFDGTAMMVRVYTRAQQVKLLLNGREVGSKDLTEKDALKAEFSVPYAPGELKAVVYDNGRETGSVTFATAGKAHGLVLKADRSKLKATRDDLSYMMVTVVDAAGRPVPDAVVRVTFSVEGEGEVAAVGNANPKDIASWRQPKRETFHGACVAIVRPKGKAGVVTLRAESPGLLSATAKLEVAG
jgi:beta-galactosidase